eukprot:454029-Pyramimonas_sp.AAC.1
MFLLSAIGFCKVGPKIPKPGLHSLSVSWFAALQLTSYPPSTRPYLFSEVPTTYGGNALRFPRPGTAESRRPRGGARHVAETDGGGVTQGTQGTTD